MNNPSSTARWCVCCQFQGHLLELLASDASASSPINPGKVSDGRPFWIISSFFFPEMMHENKVSMNRASPIFLHFLCVIFFLIVRWSLKIDRKYHIHVHILLNYTGLQEVALNQIFKKCNWSDEWWAEYLEGTVGFQLTSCRNVPCELCNFDMEGNKQDYQLQILLIHFYLNAHWHPEFEWLTEKFGLLTPGPYF